MTLVLATPQGEGNDADILHETSIDFKGRSERGKSETKSLQMPEGKNMTKSAVMGGKT